MKVHGIFIILVSTMLCSCYSYVVFPPEYRDLVLPSMQPEAHVVNPELSNELNILETSGLFALKNNSQTFIKIRLYKLDVRNACGNTISPMIEFTLGLIPVYAPDRYYFSFDEITPNDSVHHVYELKVARRISFYELFKKKADLNPKLAQALTGEYINSKKPPKQ